MKENSGAGRVTGYFWGDDSSPEEANDPESPPHDTDASADNSRKEQKAASSGTSVNDAQESQDRSEQASVAAGSKQHKSASNSHGKAPKATRSPAAIGTKRHTTAAIGKTLPTTAKFRPKSPPKYGKQALPQPYLTADEAGPIETYFDIDPPRRRNAAYRVRREPREAQMLDMPLVITGIEMRAGVAADDRAWNRKFDALRENFVLEIKELRAALGGRLRIELAWRTPLRWPRCALVTPGGQRIVETDSQELARHGVRSATMLWKSLLQKQRQMQEMARGYEALVRWMRTVPAKVHEAMANAKGGRLILEANIHKDIARLTWPCCDADQAAGPCSPLPYTVAECIRLRQWAYVKAIKQHVHAMNLIYNRITNERRTNVGGIRPAGLAVGILEGACWVPRHYWALWVRTGQVNLFYRTVTPRIYSRERGRYSIKDSQFPIAHKDRRLRIEAIDRCYLTHMKDIYRAAEHVLQKLDPLARKTAALTVQMMGKRHGSDSPAAAGRNDWYGSGQLFCWYRGQ